MERTVGASSIRNESGSSSVSRFCVLLCLTGLAIEIYFELSFIHTCARTAIYHLRRLPSSGILNQWSGTLNELSRLPCSDAEGLIEPDWCTKQLFGAPWLSACEQNETYSQAPGRQARVAVKVLHNSPLNVGVAFSTLRTPTISGRLPPPLSLASLRCDAPSLFVHSTKVNLGDFDRLLTSKVRTRDLSFCIDVFPAVLACW